jgi:histidine triad (HIT) family protein
MHSENLIEAAPALIPRMFLLSQTMARAIKEALQADGMNIIANIGAAAGQSVFHTHIHLIPRNENDGFRFRLHLKKYQPEQLQEYAGKIRNCL